MKNVLLIAIALLCGCIVNAQSSIAFDAKVLNITRSAECDKVFPIQINATNIPAGKPTNVDVTISSNQHTDVYLLAKKTIRVTKNTATDTVFLTVKIGKTFSDTDVVKLTLTDPFAKTTKELVVNITTDKTKAATSSLLNKLMFLNAYNFDFGDAKLNSNYVGHLNIFAPSINNTRSGFNVGIMKIDYGLLNDTTNNERLQFDAVKISPFDTLGNGTKYLNQLNSYKRSLKTLIGAFMYNIYSS